jgi:hypothetical protein
MLEMISFEGLVSPLAIVLFIIGGSIFYQAQNRTKAEKSSPHRDHTNARSPSAVYRQNLSVSVTKESEFPDNWLTGREVFDLEKRAIFGKVRGTRAL